MKQVKFLPTLPSLLATRKSPLIHRDLSWLQFNERVLDEARATSNPLLERVKFLAITSTNLDEFFMIRASSIERAVSSKQRKLDLRQARRLSEIRMKILDSVSKFVSKQSETLDQLIVSLRQYDIHIVTELTSGTPEFQLGQEIFEQEILPKLTAPESFSIQHLSQLDNQQMAVILPGGLWVRIPRTVPAIFSATTKEKNSKKCFFFLDDLLAQYLWPRIDHNQAPGFVRLTRDGDFTLDFGDIDPESIPDEVKTSLSRREKGKPLRLQFRGNLTTDFLNRARSSLRLLPEQIIPAPSTLCLHGLWQLVRTVDKEFPTKDRVLAYPPLETFVPRVVEKSDRIFDRLKACDYLLHHPYDSFDAYVRWIEAACLDKEVVSIEQTVYRMDALSPVIPLLKSAAKTKTVRVVIELRARFDEQNNLRLAEELRQAGVQIAFGFGRLKVHAKVALVTRREAEGLVRYSHLSTGNYNASTARQYTDLAILTAHPDIGADCRHFFDSLFEGKIPQTFKTLTVAPTKLARRLELLIQSEAEAARQGKKARVVAKVNALVDPNIIECLYEASQAGVSIDLIVRGACSLIPGVKGLSENIRVISIVDRFLEHSRIYYFEHSQQMYLSSADWMPRNFFSRLEIAFPVLDPVIYKYLEQIVIPAYLSDTAKARELTQQGTWKKRTPKADSPSIRSQVLFRELASRSYRNTPLEQRYETQPDHSYSTLPSTQEGASRSESQ